MKWSSRLRINKHQQTRRLLNPCLIMHLLPPYTPVSRDIVFSDCPRGPITFSAWAFRSRRALASGGWF
ncbi:hypothetical protein CEXT_344811 [Caerostris extrusa]|uniref:Uncharacterized protein n=1 Tax=Caerostris extrusa TaxID=172846 RepID=A0AAV4P394_CAEEX|nr:hypothetical protein CEXT_344811 [Caerostris extrusa]